MNRRHFLECLGTFAAATQFPAMAEPLIARAPPWWTGVVTVYECEPLLAGIYTFSAYYEDGLRVDAVAAKGGETRFEVCGDTPLTNPVLSATGVYVSNIDFVTDRGINWMESTL